MDEQCTPNPSSDESPHQPHEELTASPTGSQPLTCEQQHRADLLIELAPADPLTILTRTMAEIPGGDLSPTEEAALMNDRKPFADLFIAKCATKPPLEVDFLLKAGKEVFGYDIRTAKAQVHGLQAQGPIAAIKFESFVVGADFLAEAIYVPQEKTTKYVVYHPASGETLESWEIKTDISVGGTTYKPMHSLFIENKQIMLPTGVLEYREPDDTDDEASRRLYEAVRRFIGRLYHYPEGKETQLDLDTLMVFLTHGYDRFDSIPYGHSMGDFGTAKTRRHDTLHLLCYRGLQVNGLVTPAPLFRLIELYRGTLFADEMNFKGNSEVWQAILTIFLVGYHKGQMIPRCAPETHAVEGFDPFCPKFISTRKQFSDNDGALASRCFLHRTELTPFSVLKERGIHLTIDDHDRADAEVLRNKLLLWRFRNYQRLAVTHSDHIEGIEENRVQEIAQPLLALFTDDQTRKELLSHILAHGAEVREARRNSLEGVVLVALERIRQEPHFNNTWKVERVVNYVNAALGYTSIEDRRRLSNEKIGRAIKTLGFEQKKIAGGERVYLYDRRKLERLLLSHGIIEPVKKKPAK